MIFGVDFDGTCVTHEYPNVGKSIGAEPVLRKLVSAGHKIILFTMRGNRDGDLGDAIKWFEQNNIALFGVNTNPTQANWTKSPKAYCNVYIDDTALGCPLKYDPEISDRPFVDWDKVDALIDRLLSGKDIMYLENVDG